MGKWRGFGGGLGWAGGIEEAVLGYNDQVLQTVASGLHMRNKAHVPVDEISCGRLTFFRARGHWCIKNVERLDTSGFCDEVSHCSQMVHCCAFLRESKCTGEQQAKASPAERNIGHVLMTLFSSVVSCDVRDYKQEEAPVLYEKQSTFSLARFPER